MDEKIRLIIEAQNRAAPAFQSAVRGMGDIATGAKSMGTATVQSGSTVRTALQNVSNAAKSMGTAFVQAGTTIREALQHVSDAAHKVGASFTRLGQTAKAGLEKIGGPLKAVSTGLAGIGVAGTAALTAFGALGVKSNIFKENTLAAFTGMTKSKAVAEDLYKFLSKFADTTPFDDEEIVSAGKALMTFGFDAKKILTLVGDTAFTMKVPLEQVVNTLAKLKAGTFDTAEMGPVGISREGLQGMGQEFSESGEPQDRGALLGQGMALLQQKFGGAMASGASGFDAAFSTMESNFRRLAALGTEKLFGSLKTGFNAVSDALIRFMENGKAMGGLTVIFDGFGRVLELVAKAGDGFVKWLDAVVSREGVVLFLSNVLALIQTIGQSILQVFGVDLKAAMDPTNVNAFFDAMWVGTAAVIDGFFGIGRVAGEVVRMGQSLFQDMGDKISDTAEDVTTSFKRMFIDFQISMSEATAAMLENISAVLAALASISILGNKPFAALGSAATALGVQAGVMRSPAGEIGRLKDDRWGLANESMAMQAGRQARDRQRMEEDPYRKDAFGKRISDAFTGAGRDTSAQTDFGKRFEGNRLGIAGALFGGMGTAAAPAGAGFPAAPQLYGGGGGGGGGGVSIQRSPMIPSLPDGMQSVGGMSPYASQEAAAMAEYQRQNAAGYGGPTNRMTQGGGAVGGGFNATINVMAGMSWEQFQDWWLQMGEKAYQQANPAPASF